MGDGKKPAKQRTDSWFEQLQKWFTKTISIFVAGMFFLFGFGALFGAMVGASSWLIFIPFALGLLAYYSRDFALVILILFLLAIFFLQI